MKNKSNFDWDEAKNQQNILKHNVSFYDAQYAFSDPNRVILKDFSHSQNEERFYCIGKIDYGILTVRFTYRDKQSEFLVPGIGEKEKRFMKKRTIYKDEPMDNVKVVSDFLPSPEQLAYKQETVKVTITLSKNSIDYFKKVASEHNTQYQKMIRGLLDDYVTKHQQSIGA